MISKEINYWEPDEGTYNQIQALKLFVDVVANIEPFNNEQKAEDIKLLIENINNPKTYKYWHVCLDIFNRDIQNGIDKEGGIYWRKWWVFFENNTLLIEAETKHSNETLAHYGNDFCYYAYLSFKKDNKGEKPCFINNVADFVNDAKNYKAYITEVLNDIEIDLDVL